MATTERELSKAELEWGGPVTEDTVYKCLNVVRLWAMEQVPSEGDPWQYLLHMRLVRAAEPVLHELLKPSVPAGSPQ